MFTPASPTTDIGASLGATADNLLKHESKTVSKSAIALPGPDFVDRVLRDTDRPINVLRNFQTILNTGRSRAPASSASSPSIMASSTAPASRRCLVTDTPPGRR